MDIISKISHAQELINNFSWEGWLLYDFRRSNVLACDFLGLDAKQLLTRRFFYWIPRQGSPCKIVHAIESNVLESLPGTTVTFRTWLELEHTLERILKGSHRIAMEYSPRNALPYVSKVDGGTLDLIRSFGIQLESSAHLLVHFTSLWDEKKYRWHLEAAHALDHIAAMTWNYIKEALTQYRPLTEYAVQQFMLAQMTHMGFETSDPPLCAVNQHSADPHYTPQAESSYPIKPHDFILIDLWCKKKQADAVYADITRVGVASSNPTEKQESIFSVVRQAQIAATELVKTRFLRKEPVRGWEVDQTAREVIENAGYGNYFIHRTGHNIDVADHGNGTHMDNFETHDDRLLLPCTCFSIEPGIYLPGEFGVRLEYDVYIHPEGTIEITGGCQDKIKTLDLN